MRKPLPKESEFPQILAHGRTSQGVAFQLRRDAMGTLDVPGLDMALISIHVGAPAKMECRRDGKQYSGTAVHGDIDIIPVQTPSRWEMHDDNDMALLMSLPHTLLLSVAEDCGLDPARVEIRNRFQIRDPELESLSWAVKREIESEFSSGRLYLDGLALALSSRLLAQHSSQAKPRVERIDGLSGRRLKQVLSFIEERIADDLSLEQIARATGMSASHMKMQFRAAIGVPLHRYVMQRRVERAKTLLSNDGLSMAEVAAAAGFAHQSHLARHMRRALGVPPRAMKRMLAELPETR
ncbi:MAG TPA: AraC family transcriptional regulator [Bryobacteraceae bacterium]|nr:AraC family transcriptional regulator [Bryobacteraceae bacterium]